jgi:hypothetical protein
MPASISVNLRASDPASYTLEVAVKEDRGETCHTVTLARPLLARLAPSESPEDFVRRCFLFLLEREPKEAILRRFDVSVIGRYFPEFEGVINVVESAG